MYSLQCELRGKPWQTLSNTLMAIFNGIYCIYFLFLIREGKFFIEGGGGWGGGGPGLQRRGFLVNFLQIGEDQTCFILNRERVTVFLVRTKLLHVASILYIQAKATSKD